MTDIVVEVRADSGAGAGNVDAVTERVRAHGLELLPLFPGVDDPLMRRMYTVVAPDEARASELVRDLDTLEVVEAAYVKPHDAPP